MSQLSAQAIKERCVYGMPMITPFVDKKVVVNGKSYGLSAASYDVRIASDLVLGPSPTFCMRDMLLAGGGKEMLDKLSNLPPPYALANTSKTSSCPKTSAAYVVDKSTFARVFVSAFNTLIDPGFSRQPDLGAGQHGATEIVEMKVGDPICQIVFHCLDRPHRPPLRRQVPAPDESGPQAPRATISRPWCEVDCTMPGDDVPPSSGCPFGDTQQGGCHGGRRKTNSLQRLDVTAGTCCQEREQPEQDVAPASSTSLIDNLEQTGLTDAILVGPSTCRCWPPLKPRQGATSQGRLVDMFAGIKFNIVGGHHRFDGAPVPRLRDRPCAPSSWTRISTRSMRDLPARQDEHDPGQARPGGVLQALRSSLPDKYSDEIMQDAFGFAEETEFKRLIEQTAKALPDKHLQDKFKEAAAEIKTIDGLSQLLNQMFTKYGGHAAVRLHDLRPRRPAVACGSGSRARP